MKTKMQTSRAYLGPIPKAAILLINKAKIAKKPECTRQYMRIFELFLTQLSGKRALSVQAIVGLFCLIISPHLLARTYDLPADGSNVVGETYTTEIRPGETLADVGRREDMGLLELIEANPKVHPWRPRPGVTVTIPAQFVLPPGARTGLVINLPELRMYFYSSREHTVTTFPIAIGKQGWETPVAQARVIAKQENPTWTVPDSILEEKVASGIYDFPKYIGPGPKNPLGQYAIRLSLSGYMIHGTNLKGGIGSRVSHGCIRLFPKDIEALFWNIDVGAPVRIMNEPVKFGFKNGDILMESHRPLSERKAEFDANKTEWVRKALYNNPHQDMNVSWPKVDTELRAQHGTPLPVGHYDEANWQPRVSQSDVTGNGRQFVMD